MVTNKVAQVNASFWVLKICASTWIAFVLTRPFGATLGDFLTKATAAGGLNFGTIGSSLILTALLVVFIACTSVVERRRLEV